MVCYLVIYNSLVLRSEVVLEEGVRRKGLLEHEDEGSHVGGARTARGRVLVAIGVLGTDQHCAFICHLEALLKCKLVKVLGAVIVIKVEVPTCELEVVREGLFISRIHSLIEILQYLLHTPEFSPHPDFFEESHGGLAQTDPYVIADIHCVRTCTQIVGLVNNVSSIKVLVSIHIVILHCHLR